MGSGGVEVYPCKQVITHWVPAGQYSKVHFQSVLKIQCNLIHFTSHWPWVSKLRTIISFCDIMAGTKRVNINRCTVRPEWKKMEKNHNFYKYSPIVTKFSNVLNWHKLQLLASFSKIRIGNSLFFPPLSSASKLRINQTSLKLDI